MVDAHFLRLGGISSLRVAPILSATALVWVLGACTATDFVAEPVVIGLEEQAGSESANFHESGVADLNAGRFGLALRNFRLALRRDPGAVKTLNAIAVTYDQMGRFDVSRRYFERALLLEPASAQTLNNLGRSLLRQGRIDLASKYLQRAQRLAENNPVVEANMRFARAQAETRNRRSGREARTAVSTAEQAPASWIERTSIRTQTLVTKPSSRQIVLAAGLAVEPRTVGFRGRADKTATAARRRDALRSRTLPSSSVVPTAKRRRGIVEISNGVGRRRMAGRMRAYLAGRGLRVDRLTNARNFAYERTVIFYRPGFETQAKRLAEMLPVAPMLQVHNLPSSDIRMILGRDLTTFDRAFLSSSQREV